MYPHSRKFVQIHPETRYGAEVLSCVAYTSRNGAECWRICSQLDVRRQDVGCASIWVHTMLVWGQWMDVNTQVDFWQGHTVIRLVIDCNPEPMALSSATIVEHHAGGAIQPVGGATSNWQCQPLHWYHTNRC